MTRRRALSGLVRVGVGIALLALLISRSSGIDVALREDLAVVFLAAGAHVAALVAGAFRWRAYLGALDAPLGARAVAGLAAGGSFFNAFLPTGVGGDAFKALRVMRAGHDRTAAFGSVLLDRLAGLIGLAVLGSLAAAVLLVSGARRGAVAPVTLVVAVAIFAGEASLALAGAGVARVVPARLRGKVLEATTELRSASRHRARLAQGYGLGVVSQGLVVGAHLILAAGLGVRAGAATIVCAVALAQVAALLPVTINGVGLREGTYVWVLGRAGVQQGLAITFGVVNLGAMLLASLVAGAVYVALGARLERA